MGITFLHTNTLHIVNYIYVSQWALLFVQKRNGGDPYAQKKEQQRDPNARRETTLATMMLIMLTTPHQGDLNVRGYIFPKSMLYFSSIGGEIDP